MIRSSGEKRVGDETKGSQTQGRRTKELGEIQGVG